MSPLAPARCHQHHHPVMRILAICGEDIPDYSTTHLVDLMTLFLVLSIHSPAPDNAPSILFLACSNVMDGRGLLARMKAFFDRDTLALGTWFTSTKNRHHIAHGNESASPTNNHSPVTVMPLPSHRTLKPSIVYVCTNCHRAMRPPGSSNRQWVWWRAVH